MSQQRKRVIIENVNPEIDNGGFPVKRVIGEKVSVEADIFTDGHDSISATLLYKRECNEKWNEARMRSIEEDRWRGEFIVDEMGVYSYTVEAWVNSFRSWQKALEKKHAAGQNVEIDLLVGAEIVGKASERASKDEKKKLMGYADTLRKRENIEETILVALGKALTELMANYPNKQLASKYGKDLKVIVDREKALFSTWYESFPRSCSQGSGEHGTLRDLEGIIPEIARMGFDVLYLPPIHPIGETNRKGRNNSANTKPDDVGSPWAIGGREGGHKSIHPELGTMEDFESLLNRAEDYDMEIAMDLAFQCSPDHPYVKEHPEWFKWRPDGTVQFAENPPKKYEDVLPINFETENWKDLWEELKSVVIFWVEKGVRVFRVDNPHTKPFDFWEWLIGEIKMSYPDVIFLAEAFTRPKMMYRLAKIGFTQSYTYFTWRNTKSEFTSYLTELIQ
ncbi:MAG: maltotransferase domain-containing protein, partial [Thermodesulfobacteriota bacterium]